MRFRTEMVWLEPKSHLNLSKMFIYSLPELWLRLITYPSNWCFSLDIAIILKHLRIGETVSDYTEWYKRLFTRWKYHQLNHVEDNGIRVEKLNFKPISYVKYYMNSRLNSSTSLRTYLRVMRYVGLETIPNGWI